MDGSEEWGRGSKSNQIHSGPRIVFQDEKYGERKRILERHRGQKESPREMRERERRGEEWREGRTIG